MPKISIIIPVYNAEDTIKRCLDAILNNTYADYEVICINDGSKDNSLKILKDYSVKDSRIRVFDQENSGPALTRHFGVSYSKGDFIMFCDADDWYEPNMIEKMVKTMEEHNVDLVECNYNTLDFFSKSIKNNSSCMLNGLHQITLETIPQVEYVLWNKIYRKNILKSYKLQYPIKYEHDDTIFNFKYLSVINSMYGIEERLYNYVTGSPDSIMGKLRNDNNKKNKFDFLWAWQDYINFSFNITREDRIAYFYNFMASMNTYFYSTFNIVDRITYIKNLIKFRRYNPQFKNNIIEKKLFCYSAKNWISKVFSVKNSDDKSHKIIIILGIKVKIRKS